MAETKLKKVNKRLYQEPSKDGKSFKWAKRLCSLFFAVTDIRVDFTLNIERAETSYSTIATDLEEELETHQIADQQDATTPSGDQTEEQYSEHFGWRIIGIGRLKDTIGIIRRDGTVSGHEQDFDRVDVILKPVSDMDKEKAIGSLLYSDATLENRSAPYLCLELLVPEAHLEKLCDEIVAGRLSALRVGVHVDVFQSEVDSALWEPPMPKRCYIEEDEISNRAYLSWIAASRSVASGTAETNDHRSSLNDLLSAQTEALRLISQQLGTIRIVGILVAITLLLMLFLK